MAINNRKELTDVLIARVIENAPIREVLRVYSEAVTSAVANLSDEDLVRSIEQSGYNDLLEAFQIDVEDKEPALV
jgi:hypothetical protein